MSSELHHAIALEAARRGASSPSELWAALDLIDGLQRKRVIVDVGSEPAVVWAWWSLGARVISVAQGETAAGPFGGRVPETVTEIVADPRERDTVLRASDQLARQLADVLVVGSADTEDDARLLFHAYAPMVRPGGLILVNHIADPMTPWVRQFWHSLNACGSKRLVARDRPCGYGIVEIHGRDRAPHA
jgi:hypothetical protein